MKPLPVRFYLDASALAKLLLEEPESRSLVAALGESPDAISSELVRAELPRAIRRAVAHDEDALDLLLTAASSLLRRLDLIAVTGEVLDLAGALEAPSLRTLDAIHVASANLIADEIAAFVSYDRKQTETARELGLTTASPGAH